MSFGGRKCLVFFALEPSAYTDGCDILQIFLKSGTLTFNEYVNPSQTIAQSMTRVNHLTIRNSKLYRDGVLKRSRPLNVVLGRMLCWLRDLKKPCILIAHHQFHYDRLTKAIIENSLATQFGLIVVSFTNTWNMFKAKFPDCDNENLKIHQLATKGGLRWSQRKGRSIKDNTVLLEQLVALHFTEGELQARAKLTNFA